jgi:hypothetical protein
MTKDEKIKAVYTVEITLSGEANKPELFHQIAKERIQEMCLDTMSVGMRGYANIDKTKTKIIKVETK